MVPIRLCDDTICNLRTIQISLSLSKSCKDICEYICFLYEQMLKRSPHDKNIGWKIGIVSGRPTVDVPKLGKNLGEAAQATSSI